MENNTKKWKCCFIDEKSQIEKLHQLIDEYKIRKEIKGSLICAEEFKSEYQADINSTKIMFGNINPEFENDLQDKLKIIINKCFDK